ncbi:DUF4932 domain-containing protein [Clostridium sp. C2-6-12]|uniref:DUF4932 domain-containing protein n=1 Tax=Clostridium sp. C2-6-12 TaxID=2698832 RepID=UPI001370FF75|nr:DUF4932 domain-containing protein [Clostridium sp. C2-6-12]
MREKIVVLGIVCMMLLNCIGCASSNNTKTIEVNEKIANTVKESGICNVSVEPKIELLGVVQYLADAPVILKKNLHVDNQKYSDDISNYFSKYKNEEVINLCKEMMETGFTYDTAPNAMLYVDDNLKLLEDISLPETIITNAGGKEKLLKFFDLLSDFRKKSKFDDFYISHDEFYKKCVSDVKNRIDKLGLIEKIQNYYGYKQNSYNFIIQPLSIGGYGIKMPAKDGKFDLYDFMVVPNDDAEFFQMVVHEFGHSYINPLTEKNIDEINKYSNLFLPIKDDMSKQAYTDWNCCVNEHIVRAISYSVLRNTFGLEKSEEYIARDTGMKFIYISAISEKLKEYENNRDKYPSFNEFYPELIKLFKELSIKQTSSS